MGEQGVLLENRVQLPLVGGQIGDVLAVEDHLPRIRLFKAADDPEGCGLSAAGRAQKGDEGILLHRQVQVVQHHGIVKGLGNIYQIDQWVFHHSNPPVLPAWAGE